MPLCPSGSERKSTTPEFIHIDPTLYGTFLPPALVWLQPFLPFLPGTDLDMGLFCSLEPPDPLDITTEDIQTLLSGFPLSAVAVVVEKLLQTIHQYIWYQYCQCISASTPAPPAGQTPPSDLPVVNPVGPNPVTTGCKTGSNVANGVPNSQFVNLVNTNNPTGGSVFHYTFTNTNTGGSTPGSVQWSVAFYNAQNTAIQTLSLITVTSGATVSGSATLPANTYLISASVTAGAPGTSNRQNVDWSIDCGTGSIPPVAPISPQIEALLRQILDLVTLIQRQKVPFAYIPGASHTGLSGSGSLSVQGLIGFSVDITTLPSEYGIATGTPARLFDIGYVAWGTTDGYRTSQRLTNDPLLVFPLDGSDTRIGYSLSPGVVVTIKELIREP